MAAQLPDWIIVNGELKDLYSNPLEQYWTKLNKKRPVFFPLEHSTRGYVATWEVRDNELFLIGIDGNHERRSIFFERKPARFTLRTLLPGNQGKPIKASWFSGKLRIPEGLMTCYDHHDYNSRFEREMIITMYKGNVVKTVTLDYTERTLTLNEEIVIRSRHQAAQE